MANGRKRNPLGRKRSGNVQPNFRKGYSSLSPSGVPILNSSVTSFECGIVKSGQAGTHAILVGAVRGVIEGTSSRALGYLDGEFFVPAGLSNGTEPRAGRE